MILLNLVWHIQILCYLSWKGQQTYQELYIWEVSSYARWQMHFLIDLPPSFPWSLSSWWPILEKLSILWYLLSPSRTLINYLFPPYDVAIESKMEEELHSTEWVSDRLALSPVEAIMCKPLHLSMVFPPLVLHRLMVITVQVLLNFLVWWHSYSHRG